MKCNKCGTKNYDEHHYCSNCHKPLKEWVVRHICIKCGLQKIQMTVPNQKYMEVKKYYCFACKSAMQTEIENLKTGEKWYA